MTSSERVEEATRSFVEDYPEASDDLETLLEIDKETDGWTFDDIPFDSGRFGELVSRDIAEKTDDGDYQLADRQGVANALGEETSEPSAATETAKDDEPSEPREYDWAAVLPRPGIDPGTTALLVFALALLAGVRSMFYDAVFRDGYVVSPANDPYYYRYWQEQFLASTDGPTDLSILRLIGEEANSRPVTHLTNWWFGELFGAAVVAAWLPVAFAVLLGLVVYALAIKLTTNRRIAITSVLLLALTPVLAVYTSLGFLEHRAHQYLWLAVMTYALVWLATDLRERYERAETDTPARDHATDRRAWAMAGVLAIAMGASAHAWGGSPLTFVPVAVYLAMRGAADVRADVPPLTSVAPTLGGTIAGGIIAWELHSRYGWHEAIAGSIPLLVAAGGLAVALAASAWRRTEIPARWFVGLEAVIGIVGLQLFRMLRPEDVSRLQERSDALFGRGEIVEAASLFSTEQFVIFGPITQLGFGFFLALVPLGFLTWYMTKEYDPAWLVVICFTWVWFVLATIQVRFAAQLSIFIAMFGGIAVVYLLGVLELADRPTLFPSGESSGARADGGIGPASEESKTLAPITLPEPKVGAYIVGILGFILLMNLIFVPTLLSDIYYSDDQFGATATVLDHADEHPDTQEQFVLSHWADNRMHNYFLTGESRGYGYARSNHDQFLVAEDPDEWYNNFNGRAGYVVITQRQVRYAPAYVNLFNNLGAGEEPVAHYQLLYSTDDVKAFAIVDGAQLRTTTDANATVTASTDVSTAGESFSYERSAEANGNGQVTIRVAYPGEYSVGNETVTINESAVYEGSVVEF